MKFPLTQQRVNAENEGANSSAAYPGVIWRVYSVTSPDATNTGGCSCGGVRYEFIGGPEQIVVCHCPDCRRAVGAQSVAYVFLSLEKFRLTKGTPKTHNPSPKVTRSFCGNCGTTLSWVGDAQPGRIDVTVGSLDNPGQFKPTRAVYRKHRLAWASEI